MIIPTNLPLAGDRYCALIAEIAVSGVDLTGAAFAAQVRDSWNGGTLRADLATVTDPADEGVALVSVIETDGVTTSLLSLRIAEATMEAMPSFSDEDIEIVWDLQVTPSGGDAQVYVRGPFTIRAGSTQ